tara:strand:+ start:98 stop:244 length:147 start_codon:yes stop_codon:yes gene_type:complete
MAKCALCGKKIETTFLGKLKGTYLKKKPICSPCQKDLPNLKEKITKKL